MLQWFGGNGDANHGKMDVCCCTEKFTFLKMFSNFAVKIHRVEMIESDSVPI